MSRLLHDLRYALRQLRKSLGFTSVAVLTLALGIGATTAMFSIVDTVVLKPLPFSSANRLVRIRSVLLGSERGSGVASYPDFLDWQARNHVFAAIAAFRTKDFVLTDARQSLHLQGAIVSAQLFSVLGATPVLGRSFTAEENRPAATGGNDPVILSYGLWQGEFGGDQSVLGRPIQLAKQAFTIIGVMGPGFQFPIQAEPVEFWTTIAFDARGGASALTEQRGAHYLDVIGRLAPGATIERAQAEMASIANTLNHENPYNKPRRVNVLPEIQDLVGPVRAPLEVLMGAVACVLLIVCVNLANLLLARGTGRHKEMAVRAALGATRRRVIGQLLTETVVLGFLGGGLGLVLALLTLKSLMRLSPTYVPRLSSTVINVRLLGFAFAISLLAGILSGLIPALRVSSRGWAELLRDRNRSGGREYNQLHDMLVVSEVTLALMLSCGAGLLIRSFFHLMQVHPGFETQNVLSFQIDSPSGDADSRMQAMTRDTVAAITTIPGVTSASAVASLPLTGDYIRSSVEVESRPTDEASRPSVDFNAVGPNFFRTLGIALKAGRDFTEHDDSNSPPVVIVNQTLARNLFSNENPIGKRIRPGIVNGYGLGLPPMREIVGVVADVKQAGLGAEAFPEVYAPMAQSPFSSMFIVVHAASDPSTIIEAIRSQVALMHKNVPIYHIRTLAQYFARSIAIPRFVALLLTGFAGLALLLTCLGVYGLIAYMVVERTREIGVRVALGAAERDVLRMLVGNGLRLGLTGIAIGIAFALKLSRVLSGLLFGVEASDPLTFFGVSITVFFAILLASYFPARRALNVDPATVLRLD